MAQDQGRRPVREQSRRFRRRRRVGAARVRHRRSHVARRRGHRVRPRNRRVAAVAAQINKEDFVVRLALDELTRGGHPVSSLTHYTVQAYNNTRFSEGGLAFQSAARDPLVREDGHFFFSVLYRCARGDGCDARRQESGVVERCARDCVAPRGDRRAVRAVVLRVSRPDYPQRCKRRVVVMYTAKLSSRIRTDDAFEPAARTLCRLVCTFAACYLAAVRH